jgi:uncharacterized repeat protein (TIGR01451 family)
MEKISIVFLFLLSSLTTATSQNCDPSFYYYDSATQFGKTQLEASPNTGFWLSIATPESPTSSYNDMAVIRVDALGNEIWRKKFGLPNEREINADLLATQDGNMLFISNGNDKIQLTKLDDNGNIIWQKEFGETNKIYESIQMYEDAQGNILIAGSILVGSVRSVLVLKLDSQGTLLKKKTDNPFIAQWVYSILDPSYGFSRGFAIKSSNDGGYLLSGISMYTEQGSSPPANALIYKLDTDLNIIWNKDFFGSYGCFNTLVGQAVFQNADNTIALAINAAGACVNGTQSSVLYRLDPSGTKLSEKVYATGGVMDVLATDNGKFISCSGGSNFTKIDAAGNIEWQNRFKNEMILNSKNSIIEFTDGHLAFVGTKYINNGYKAVVAITDSLGNNCKNRLSGYVYYDKNGNCKRDSNDIGLPNKLLQLNTGPAYTLTDPNGQYAFIADTTLQNIQAYPTSSVNQPSDFWQITCPPSGIQTFVSSAPYQKPDSLHFALSAADNCPVFQIKSGWDISRVCNKGVYQLEICNDGSLKAENVNASLSFPQEFKFVSANRPYSIVGNSYVFEIGALEIGQCQTLIISDSIRCSASLGVLACIEAVINGTPNCNSFQYTKSDQLCRLLTNSYDPNDITGWVDNKTQCFEANTIGQKKEIEYMIQFQNTGNDVAYRVMVIDTLPIGVFDLTTLRPGLSSHPYQLDIRGDRTLVWIFDDINLTDSTTNLEKSKGFVTFSIHTKSPVTNATTIKNKAAIYFDTNLPIITNESDIQKCVTNNQNVTPNYLDLDLTIVPNPASDYAEIRFNTPSVYPLSVKLYDLSGKLIDQANIKNGVSNYQISTQSLSNGVYFVHIGSEKKGYLVRKLVIMH